jgi:hypothetical protein
MKSLSHLISDLISSNKSTGFIVVPQKQNLPSLPLTPSIIIGDADLEPLKDKKVFRSLEIDPAKRRGLRVTLSILRGFKFHPPHHYKHNCRGKSNKHKSTKLTAKS